MDDVKPRDLTITEEDVRAIRILRAQVQADHPEGYTGDLGFAMYWTQGGPFDARSRHEQEGRDA